VHKVTPYKSSSKDYSLSAVDYDIVTRYRAWLADYFENEFNYEATLFMNLSKVREFILNEGQSSSSLANNNKVSVPNFNYPREYDLVVRVDEISTLKEDLAKRVMTGGRQPEIKVKFDLDNNHMSKTTEESKAIKISDTATM